MDPEIFQSSRASETGGGETDLIDFPGDFLRRQSPETGARMGCGMIGDFVTGIANRPYQIGKLCRAFSNDEEGCFRLEFTEKRKYLRRVNRIGSVIDS